MILGKSTILNEKPYYSRFLLCCRKVQPADSAQYFCKGTEKGDATKIILIGGWGFDKTILSIPNLRGLYPKWLCNMAMYKNSQAISQFFQSQELDPGSTITTKELMELYYNYRQFPKRWSWRSVKTVPILRKSSH